MPLEDQLVKIGVLKGQGKTLEQIAEATGLEMGDVQSALSGALPAGVSTKTTPEALAAQTFLFLPEIALPGTHQNTFADRTDASDLVTVPALTMFMVNYDAELSGAPDPGNAAIPMNLAVQVVARPVSGVWGSPQGGGNADAPLVQGNNPALPGGSTPNTYYEVFGGSTVYVTQFTQDVKLAVQYMASNAGNTLEAGSKMRNLKVTLVTMNPSLAA